MERGNALRVSIESRATGDFGSQLAESDQLVTPNLGARGRVLSKILPGPEGFGPLLTVGRSEEQ